MRIFVTGGTGYIGSRLIPELVGRGHEVLALVRESSIAKLPGGCMPVLGNALDAATYQNELTGIDTFIQLVGVPHPSPGKSQQFCEVDRRSGMEAIGAALRANVPHFVYLSVAHPAPMMRDYIAVRAECEAAIAAAGLNATIVRPWYVLGPGHRWPYALLPFYWMAQRTGNLGNGARRLGLVTIQQMIATLAAAVEEPPRGVRILGVPEIRACQTTQRSEYVSAVVN